jgi:hypothetical protein
MLFYFIENGTMTQIHYVPPINLYKSWNKSDKKPKSGEHNVHKQKIVRSNTTVEKSPRSEFIYWEGAGWRSPPMADGWLPAAGPAATSASSGICQLAARL